LWLTLMLLGCSTCAREAPPEGKAPPEHLERIQRVEQHEHSPEPKMTTPRSETLRIRAVAHSPLLKQAPAVQIVLSSPRAFPAGGAMPVLHIGEHEFRLSRYPLDGDLHTLIFTLTPEQFDAVRDDDAVIVQYDGTSPDRVWSFGPLEKP